MKIGLIAPSAAGKTAYLTLLYNTLSQGLSNGHYGIDTLIQNSLQSGNLKRRYQDLLHKGDFGPGSSETTSYTLALTTKNKGLDYRQLEVHVIDFPGRYLYDSTADTLEEAEKTKKQLAECDGFIVLLDGGIISEGLERLNQKSWVPAGIKGHDVQNILKQAIDRHQADILQKMTEPNEYAFGKGPAPIAFAITKFDRLVALQAGNPEKFLQDLKTLLKNLFSLNDNAVNIVPGEKAFPLFVRSQYGSLIRESEQKNPNIVTLRSVLNVFDETENKLDAQYIAEPFQFVVFQGLLNAKIEYLRRLNEWSKAQAERKSTHSSAERELLSTQAEKTRFERQDWLDRVGGWWNDRGQDYHANRVSLAHAQLTSAVHQFNETVESIAQVQHNLETVELFLQRILSDKFAYFLTKPDYQDNKFRQNGLPITQLARENWWQEKLKRAEKLIAAESTLDRLEI